MLISQTYRIYPTQAQERRLQDCLAWCFMLWNHIIRHRREDWEKVKHLSKEERFKCSRFGRNEASAYVTAARAALPRLAESVPAEISREVASRIDAGYKGFYRLIDLWKAGKLRAPDGSPAEKPEPPAFAKELRLYRTLDCWQPDRIRMEYVKGKFGWLGVGKFRNIRIRIHRVIKGEIRAITIRKEPDGWYARISYEVENTWHRHAVKSVGVNLGCRNLIARTDGKKVAVPRERFLDLWKRIARLDKIASRRKRGSKRWRKIMDLREKACQHLRRSRDHFIKVHAHRLTRDFQEIVVEKMNLALMIMESGGIKYRKTGVKAKTIVNATIGKFVAALKWKCEMRGRAPLREVPAAYTTRTCSQCGHVNDEIPLRVRTFTCAKCGHTEDREFNAAKNDLARGRSDPSGSGDASKGPATNREGEAPSGAPS